MLGGFLATLLLYTAAPSPTSEVLLGRQTSRSGPARSYQLNNFTVTASGQLLYVNGT